MLEHVYEDTREILIDSFNSESLESTYVSALKSMEDLALEYPKIL